MKNSDKETSTLAEHSSEDGPKPYRHRDALPACISSYLGHTPGYVKQSSGKLIISQEIRDLFGSKVFLSTKQVPSALSLSRTGQRSINSMETLQQILEMGFPLLGFHRTARSWERVLYDRSDVIVLDSSERGTVLTRESGFSTVRSVSSYDVDGRSGRFDTEEDSLDPIEVDPNLAQFIKDEYEVIKLDVSDFFDVMRAKELAQALGEKEPKILSWNADVIRLQDKIPVPILQAGGYTGKSGIEFSRIVDPELREFVIFEHTYWGQELIRLCKSENEHEASFGRLLKKRLIAFLRCRRDPSIKARHYEELFLEDYQGTSAHRCERLIECLKTVDGIFVQRFLIDPAERWTWKKFDMFILGNLSVLLTDEFLDGSPTDYCLTLQTNYASLKKIRKFVKLSGHLGRDDLMPMEYPPWLDQFRAPIGVLERSEGKRKVQRLALLSQTRGCGTPPPLDLLKSKIKFLQIVSTEPKPIPKEGMDLVKLAMNSVLEGIQDENLTGLRTAAQIRITTSACYERAVAENGTAQAINDLVFEAEAGREVWILDLDTGERLRRTTYAETTVGEYIFWRSLEEVLATPPDILRRLKMVMVAEPGKGRTVSKGSACLKIVLDVINKITAKPFAKAFPSSSSGMEKSNHGWNVYKSFFHGELKEMIFNAVEQEIIQVGANEDIVTTTWEQVFASSTDFDTATDFCNHQIARCLANGLMLKVGIPPLLRGIVNECCFRRRTIEFTATAGLKAIGVVLDEKTNYVNVVTGIMMGDPLTKVILHMINMCTRRLAELLGKPQDLNVLQAASIRRLLEERYLVL